jgi:hypothetical protein
MKKETVTLVTFADKKGFDSLTAFNNHLEVFNFFNYSHYKHILVSENFFKEVKMLFRTATIYILSKEKERLSADPYLIEKSKLHKIEIVDAIPSIKHDEDGRSERLYIIEDQYIRENTEIIEPDIINLRLGNAPQINLNDKYFLSEHCDLSPDVYFTNFQILDYGEYLGRIESRNRDYEKHVGGFRSRNIITYKRDDSCSMAEVLFNDRCVMLGNNWDFHNGCHGLYSIPDFNSAYDLIILIKTECLRQKLEVEVVEDKNWKYA